jgi:hypothetical protein
MTTTKEMLHDAQVLARFSNLEADDVEYFRNNFAGFVPSMWWQTSVGSATDPIWKHNRENARRAWKEGFPPELCIRLIASGTLPDTAALSAHDFMADNVVHIPLSAAAAYRIDPDLYNQEAQVWPYQMAVMYLAVNPWRAATCACGNRFVADKPSRRFCSDKCFQDSRKRSRMAWWTEKGSKARRKTAKAGKKKRGA